MSLIGGLAACIYGIPGGSAIVESLPIGNRSEGTQIVRETREEHRVFPVSPEGFFYDARLRYVDYYAQTMTGKTKLGFFSNIGLSYMLLKPILPIGDTNSWAAFRLSRVARDDVDLTMYVFDDRALIHTFVVKDAVRTDRSAQGWELGRSYSILQSADGSSVTVETRHGVETYDANAQRMAPR